MIPLSLKLPDVTDCAVSDNLFMHHHLTLSQCEAHVCERSSSSSAEKDQSLSGVHTERPANKLPLRLPKGGPTHTMSLATVKPHSHLWNTYLEHCKEQPNH